MKFSTGISSLLAGTTTLVSAHTWAIRRSALDDCLNAASVPTDAQNSAAWAADVAPFNKRLPYTPIAIAVPTSASQVQAAVACAASAGVKISPKGGGHSYASFGLGGEDGHLVLEMDRMFNVTVDATTNIATIQSGARLGHVFTALYAQGKRAISHGTCPGVGIAGHSLHGGFGFSSHVSGLALDWIAGAEVVLANATIVNCSATKNPDLYWAIRGAGSSFGVVTNFYFNTFAAPTVVTPFSISASWSTQSQAVASWTAIQNFTLTSMAPEMNMRVFVSTFAAQIQGLYYGTSANLTTAAAPLIAALGSGARLQASKQTDWPGGFAAYDNGDTVDASVPYNKQENFFSKSLATTALPPAAMSAAVAYWFNTAKSNTRDWYLIIDLHGGNNSYIANQDPSLSSYAHRDKLFLYEFYDRVDSGTYPAQGFDFLNGWVESFTSNLNDTQWGMYINYADPTMNRTYAQEVYWRQNVPRLQQIKKAVDPTELFYFPQSIQPAA